ncbi:hypothetical protein ESZ53_06115 [Salinibacterium sp. UTAS2018]|uniref:hypothetical protein n=1 Tax=Salinibacterium sp. UTAS2018 TaxID=2508880 RepID=UPI001009466A|nr:hypothetical protein [Salinibacterium sp. UTAS2018]QAV70047.1 hypothetical protein ESZ53_06115 [Salinibacterium sp. UTAS2018]
MKNRSRKAAGVPIAFLAAASMVMTTSPAFAAPQLDGVDLAEDTVNSLVFTPETGPIADAGTFLQKSDGSLVSETDNARLIIESGDAPAIELSSDFYEPLRIDAALPGSVSIADKGSAVFESNADYSVVPLPQDDGAVQLVTILDSSESPERFDYDFSSTSDVTLNLQENGMVIVLDEAGGWLGGVASPWAFDSEGTAVPTHFEVLGSTLTQVVEHQSGDFVYPISADPYANQNLWGSSSIDFYNGDQRVNLRLSAWGASHQLPWILIDYGWPEALGRSALMKSVLTSKASMRQQFDCHAFGSAFAGDWNLEKFRPNRTALWSYGVAIHHCNWTTSYRY